MTNNSEKSEEDSNGSKLIRELDFSEGELSKLEEEIVDKKLKKIIVFPGSISDYEKFVGHPVEVIELDGQDGGLFMYFYGDNNDFGYFSYDIERVNLQVDGPKVI